MSAEIFSVPSAPHRRSMRSVVENHFNALAPEYDSSLLKRDAYLKRQEALIIEKLKTNGASSVLDAGCGSGARAMRIKNILPAVDFWGYDLSPKMVSIAQQREYEQVVEGSMTNPPFEDKKFDATLCLFSAFNYLSSPEERKLAVQGFHRCLKDGGLLFIDMTNRWHQGENSSFQKRRPKILYELLISLFDPRLRYGDVVFDKEIQGKLSTGFYHSMTDREFRRLFKSHFVLEKKYIVGYDTGDIKKKTKEGNFMYVYRKKQTLKETS